MANLYRNPNGTIARRSDGKLMRAPTQAEFEDSCCKVYKLTPCYDPDNLARCPGGTPIYSRNSQLKPFVGKVIYWRDPTGTYPAKCWAVSVEKGTPRVSTKMVHVFGWDSCEECCDTIDATHVLTPCYEATSRCPYCESNTSPIQWTAELDLVFDHPTGCVQADIDAPGRPDLWTRVGDIIIDWPHVIHLDAFEMGSRGCRWWCSESSGAGADTVDADNSLMLYEGTSCDTPIRPYDAAGGVGMSLYKASPTEFWLCVYVRFRQSDFVHYGTITLAAYSILEVSEDECDKVLEFCTWSSERPWTTNPTGQDNIVSWSVRVYPGSLDGNDRCPGGQPMYVHYSSEENDLTPAEGKVVKIGNWGFRVSIADEGTPSDGVLQPSSIKEVWENCQKFCAGNYQNGYLGTWAEFRSEE